ncbi:transglutaminase-like domain-containing protein [Clostridium perfringens]|uniref:Transglutaminase n=1 Tax=Clostridium perfringens TaxID=1502 RepID=A0A140GSB0_CLOPF|nr:MULTISPECIES: transglutaminase-like domain-containing protein [Clostridium]AMN36420.1 transglutaminase [Clostridium perfringens]MDK7588934.1 transglutaminase-like domain-containing protein [Clostridium sp. UMB9555B]MDK7626727.1 transglutaminase-like domain-containing protein [Clostridium sp. UMB9555A]TGY47021.1 transglutaminase domain-containing protein [Clostridium perfringens]
MNFNLVDIIIVCSFILPLVVAYKRKFNIIRIKNSIEELGGYISFFLALYLSFIAIKKIDIIERMFSIVVVEFNNIISNFNVSPQVIIIFIVLALTLVIYFIVKIILKIFSFIIINPILRWLKKAESRRGKGFGKVAALIINIPKSLFYMAVIALVIVILGSNGFLGEKMEGMTLASKAYEVINSNKYYAALNKEYEAFHNEYKDVISKNIDSAVESNKEPKSENVVESNKNVINLYNGVTLEQGIKSNEAINKKAKELTKNAKSSREKAKRIYTWISENINYDDNKAENISEKTSEYKSGAIEAFETRKGICFDYSCLYVAMAREAGLKVRIVTGEGFNGKEWGPHSWNEVYLPEKNQWITVDPTFGKAGNYFDSKKNSESHRDGKIVGEW